MLAGVALERMAAVDVHPTDRLEADPVFVDALTQAVQSVLIDEELALLSRELGRRDEYDAAMFDPWE